MQAATELHVHPADRAYLEAHNRLTTEEDFRLKFDLPPHPWCGLVGTASIVLLALNPGWEPLDAPAIQSVVPAMRRNLAGDLPNMWLDSKLAGTGGTHWHRETLLKEVLVHIPEEVVAHEVALVEWHAYASRRWSQLHLSLPTQWFSFHLVEESMNRGALVVILRGARQWKSAVPSLIDYARCLEVRSRNARLSSKNLGPDNWHKLLAALRNV